MFILLCSVSVCSQAEIYQWTDEHGQTHFGDRAPNTSSAKDISKQVNQINITSDLSSPEMMLRLAQEKDAERLQQIQERRDADKNKPSKKEQCKSLRSLLKIVKGRVVFVDDEGKDLKISESERNQKAIELEHQIRKYCQ